MWTFWAIGGIFVAILITANAQNQNDVMGALLNRMDAIEGRVDSLSDEVASLESRLTEIDGGERPEPTDFKVVNLTQTREEGRSVVTYTLLYEAQDQLQILKASSAYSAPVELPIYEPGRVQFSIPDSAVSPVLYVCTSSNLIYTLILIQAEGGPPPESPEEIPNLILTTSPESSLAFEENEDPEVTVSSHVTGSRAVRKEGMYYYVYVLRDFAVDYVTLFQLYEDNLENPHAQNDDVNAGNDANHPSQRLRLLDHNRNGRDTRDRLVLETSYENSGVLFVEKRFEFECRSCVLYEMRVTKAIPYFLDNGEYVLGEGALVAYKDLYNFGPDFIGPRYFRFIRYNQSEDAHHHVTTCSEGDPCAVMCEAFGDNPTVYFNLFGSRLRSQPTYYDQSGNRLVSEGGSDPPNAKIKGWSVRARFQAFSIIHFDEVRREDAKMYYCFAEIDSGLMLRRSYMLTVV